MLRLVWTFHWHTEVIGLFLGQLRQLSADFLEVQAGNFTPGMGSLSVCG